MEANDLLRVLGLDLDLDDGFRGDEPTAPAATVAARAALIVLIALALIRRASSSFLNIFPGRSNSTMRDASSGSAGLNV